MDESERIEYLRRKEQEEEDRRNKEEERNRIEQEAASQAAEEARLQAELLARYILICVFCLRKQGRSYYYNTGSNNRITL